MLNENAPFRATTRFFFALMLLLAVAAPSGCGRQAPSFAPATLTVDSEPPGAAIFLDGTDSGQVTPYTFASLDHGPHEVIVHLDGYVSYPDSKTVNLPPLGVGELHFSLTQTGIQVTSNPAGAAVILDGLDTGQSTPTTLAGIEPGPHTLHLQLAGHHVFPAQLPVVVTAGQVLDVPASSFLVRSDRTVLCEGFTNINCAGCPQLSTNLHDMQADPLFGPDKVVILKYSMQWPLISDPHYQYNRAENDGRLQYYGQLNIVALPTLFVDGAMVGTAGTPPDRQGIKDAVLGESASSPGFLVDVAADLTDLSVGVIVTLTAPDGPVDLGDAVLRVALVQSHVDYTEPPVQPNLGETTFYWVFRDQAPDLSGLGALETMTPRSFQASLTRSADWDLETIQVIAYVQNDIDKTILQAGSTMVIPVAQAGSITLPQGTSP